MSNQMRTRGMYLMAAAAALGAGLSSSALAQQDGATPMTTVRVANGLTLPLYATHAFSADTNRLFVVEQRSATTGRIKIINNLYGTPTVGATPFISISPVATGNEEGLLGLAFHPNYAENGYFYVYFTNSSGNQVIRRYRANGPDYRTAATADPASGSDVLTIPHPTNSNHNGGWIDFGLDGYLYIATGDGGSANDPPGNAQNINQLLGKMLRIDVDGADNIPGNDDDDGDVDDPPSNNGYTNPTDNPFFGATAGRDEIWAIGLRNPWRNGFDSENGDLYIADVGQNAAEEVDVRRSNSPTTPVFNFGWRCMEGNSCTGLSGCTCGAATLTAPVHTYTHAGGACSITGGQVYRGCAMPEMQGIYFFADYCNNQISSFRYNRVTNTISELTNRTAELDPPGASSITSITGWGTDALGEIYIVEQGGEVWRIVPTSVQGADCNANGRSDACDIRANAAADCDANGTLDSCQITENPALDCDANGVLDSCELASRDCNANGIVDACDIAADPALDCDKNGVIDSCELGTADCNKNGIVDACDIAADPTLDCNKNGAIDSCELSPNNDCDANGQLDSCEIAANPALDCDGNGVLDSCELAEHDCNANGILDACDIANGAPDCYEGDGGSPGTAGGADGIPDDCQCVADWNRDGTTNSTDVSDFVNTYFDDQLNGTRDADIFECGPKGVTNSTDVSEFINIWFAAQAGQLPFSGCQI